MLHLIETTISRNCNTYRNKQPYSIDRRDYQYICEIIRGRVANGLSLTTITGLNGILQIRTKDSKYKGKYHPIIWEGREISNKGYAFYLTGKYIKSLI